MGREEHRRHRGGHLRISPPPHLLSRRHRVQLFEKEHGWVATPIPWLSTRRTGAWRSTPASWCTTTAPIRIWCGCSTELGVATRDSDMSFAVSCRRSGLEYSSRGANGFFAQRRNLVRPSHLSLLREILRFNREAPALLDGAGCRSPHAGDFLESRRFGDDFTHRYLLPMASAIWSTSLDAIRSFPALTLVRFFDNHGLLSVNGQPTWKVVAGGSHIYIPTLMAPLSGDIHPGASIDSGPAERATASR